MPERLEVRLNHYYSTYKLSVSGSGADKLDTLSAVTVEHTSQRTEFWSLKGCVKIMIHVKTIYKFKNE